MRRNFRQIVILGLLCLFVASASYATSARGTVNGNVSRFYGFTMPDDGAVEITLAWNQNHADLFLIMTCGSTDPLEYSSVATENRVARLDVGVLRGLSCVVGIASFQRVGTFTMILSTSGRGPGIQALSSGLPNLELLEATETEVEAFGVTEVEEKLRRIIDRR